MPIDKILRVMLDNEILENPNVSWRAKGLLGYLLSCSLSIEEPDIWKFNISDITISNADGKDATRSGLKELEQHGYVKKVGNKWTVTI